VRLPQVRYPVLDSIKETHPEEALIGLSRRTPMLSPTAPESSTSSVEPIVPLIVKPSGG